MSTENISTHPSVGGVNQIPTVHHEAFIRHAVRNIKGADKLCDSLFRKHQTFVGGRLHEVMDTSHNNLRTKWT
jgi:hypothetical protein